MINIKRIEAKKEEILTLKTKLANAKKEYRLIPDGYIYIITSSDYVLDSTCVNLDTALEELDNWLEDEMVSNPILWTNNLKAQKYAEENLLFDSVKIANISELQDLSEGKG